MREGRIESRHSIKSLEGMGSRSHDLGVELRMHSYILVSFSLQRLNFLFDHCTKVHGMAL